MEYIFRSFGKRENFESNSQTIYLKLQKQPTKINPNNKL